MFLLLEKKKSLFKVSLVSFLKHFNLLFKAHFFLPMISHGWKREDTAGGMDLCSLDSCLGQCRPHPPTCLSCPGLPFCSGRAQRDLPAVTGRLYGHAREAGSTRRGVRLTRFIIPPVAEIVRGGSILS